MRKVNLKEIAEEERKSPKGKYHKFVKDISIALGREKESLDLNKRHPFDLALVRIPKGKDYCPYHGHGAESELYLVVSGKGKVRHHGGMTEVRAGDSFFFAPGQAHQLSASCFTSSGVMCSSRRDGNRKSAEVIEGKLPACSVELASSKLALPSRLGWNLSHA